MTPINGISRNGEQLARHDVRLPMAGACRLGRRLIHLFAGLAAAIAAILLISACPDSLITASAAGPSPLTPAVFAKNPDAVCSRCHQAIYEEYERTSMARGSGLAAEGLLLGGFVNAPSGIRYEVFLRDGSAWMSYDREAESRGAGGGQSLHGERQLTYFIGSGRQGRTYLYEEEGQWFEAPINYYSRRRIWDMAPNYGAAKTMPQALPVDSNCLHCHATDVQTALSTARNKYDGPPFRQAGIGCSGCHGDPSKHLAEHGEGPIVNPTKLTAERRDSVCLQCHLEGNVAVYRAGKSLAQFRAGDNLGDYAVYFVKTGAEAGGGRASSQYEALLRSACKRASGDKLTCTTCHDSHSSPGAEDRVSYFRGKCLGCHTGVRMATEHHPEQQDCAVCHMPSRPTTDISHEQETDHNIEARPSSAEPVLRLREFGFADELTPVGKVSVGDRELGLAYAQLGERGDQQAGEKALRLLRQAEADGVADVQVHTQLGFLDQVSGHTASARAEYADALIENPDGTTIMGNLAVLDAGSGRAGEAVDLLQRVVDEDPSEAAAGLNLAFIECRMGDKGKALKILTGLARFDPDDPTLRMLLSTGFYQGQVCKLR
jgi:hypothetical protein